MTAASHPAYDTDLLDALSQRVLVGDGAMGTQLQAAQFTLDDFAGLEGCNEILNETRPDVLETIHRGYFEAGADAVRPTPSAATCPTSAITASPRRSASCPRWAPRSPAGSPTS
jgi:methionine synthase I (cobalamin-dependent)